jgi:hypothetical protein
MRLVWRGVEMEPDLLAAHRAGLFLSPRLAPEPVRLQGRMLVYCETQDPETRAAQVYALLDGLLDDSSAQLVAVKAPDATDAPESGRTRT